MSKQLVVICCWNCGEQSSVALTAKQEEKLSRQLDDGAIFCQNCQSRDAFVLSSKEVFRESVKLYQCEQGHITAISVFKGSTGGLIHVAYGRGRFENVPGTPDNVQKLVDEKAITCNHDCGLALQSVDEIELSYPELHHLKTRTRIGDLWDKNGIEPVRGGSYGSDGDYKPTKSELANKERLSRMQRTRNIDVDRLPDTRSINKPTDKTYKPK